MQLIGQWKSLQVLVARRTGQGIPPCSASLLTLLPRWLSPKPHGFEQELHLVQALTWVFLQFLSIIFSSFIHLTVNRAGEVIAASGFIKNWTRCSTVCWFRDDIPFPSTLSSVQTPVTRLGARTPLTPSADLNICWSMPCLKHGSEYRAVNRAVEVIAGPGRKKNWTRNPSVLSFSLDNPSSSTLTKATWL